jgi:hypothetical protein
LSPTKGNIQRVYYGVLEGDEGIKVREITAKGGSLDP